MSKRSFRPPPPKAKEPRINHRISAPRMRVIVDGEARILERQQAIDLAEQMGLDLVEVSPEQDPPVCKIIDYGKYKYEQQKKKKEAQKNQHIINVKEIKLRPKIAGNDYELKRRNARSFLEEGDKVKVTLRFRGREIAHPELGMKIVERMAADLVDAALVESSARMDGRQIVMVLAPKPGLKKKSDPSKKEVDGAPGTENVSTPVQSGQEKESETQPVGS